MGEFQVLLVNLLEVVFYVQFCVYCFEDKVGFGIVEDYYLLFYQYNVNGVLVSDIIDVIDVL